LRRTFARKFPDKLDALEQFITNSMSDIEIIKVSDASLHPKTNELIRDPKDAPILLAAIENEIDIIIILARQVYSPSFAKVY
jgi:predicted nucleic acid-binding protein